ncbi:hypothetical protein ACLSSQ_11905 [Azospira sp. APE16]|uniref:hypothetical protein n=1 Tax=Azospira sp. APE16 TaxID=3394231 RepID=UPI003A4D32B9
MTDLKEIQKIADDFSRTPLNLKPFKKRSRKDVADGLRAVFWYHTVRHQLGEKSSYALEKRFDEKGSFKRNADGKLIYPHRWQKYSHGERVPIPSLVVNVEKECKGSARKLNHVLWEALRLEQPVCPHVEVWLRELNPDIQMVVFHIEHREFDVIYKREKIGLRLLGKLSDRASMDALACLTILFREAVELERFHDAFLLGREIHWMLLFLGIEFQRNGVGKELIKLYCDRIFPMLAWDEQCFFPERTDYVGASCFLNLSPFYHPAHKGKSLSWETRVRCMRRLSSTRGNWAVMFGLDIEYGPNPDSQDIPKKLLQEYERRKRIVERAKEAISLGISDVGFLFGRRPPPNTFFQR